MEKKLVTLSDSAVQLFVLLLLMSIVASATAVPFLSQGSLPVPGFVYKQGRVLDSEGFPVYAEYDSDPESETSGEVIKTIKELDGSDKTLSIISRAEFKATSDALNAWKNSLAPGFYDTLKIINASDFDPNNYPEAYRGIESEVFPRSRSLLVYKPDALDGSVTLSEGAGLIVQQSVFSITDLLSKTGFGGERGSLVINGEGTVVYPATPDEANDNTIGFRVAYFKPTAEHENPDRTDTDLYTRWQNDELEEDDAGVREAFIKPLSGIVVSAYDHLTATDDNGFFVYHMAQPFCMGAQNYAQTSLSAHIPYRKLNPQKIATGFHYYISNPYSYSCFGIPTYPPTDLTSASALTSTVGVVAGTSFPTTQPMNFPVDVTEIDGTFTLDKVTLGAETKRLPVDETEQDYVLPEHPDFNNDGETDEHVSELNSIQRPDGAPEDSAPLFGVWFSLPDDHEIREQALPYDADGEPIPPDLVRVATQAPNFADIGLLETISKDDLVETDIYVFRESTGQLVMEKSPFYLVANDENGEGVEGSDKYSSPLNGLLKDDPAGRGYFGVTIPGRDANRSLSALNYAKANDGTVSVETYSAWQQTRFVEADFRGKTDSLREGEPIRVVLINRATGYIGTAYSHIEVKQTENSQEFDNYGIGLNLGDITLTPPNLKVNVKRSYKVKHGLTQGESRDYRVGSEGAGLHSDEYILVTTDWRDQDGSPLPSGLPGYTGRITSLSGDKTLADNAVGHFEVKPGLHTEYIALPNADSAVAEASYQYIHIVGEQLTDSPDFSASDATHNRPTKYVPLKVAVYDETASRALKAAQLENPDNTLAQDSSVYQWVYRPEMMYAVFDLDVTEITRTPTGDDGEAGDPIDITGSTTPTITAGDAELAIVQDLIASEYDPLDFFGPDSHLVYSLEGYQQEVNPGEDTTYTYTDFGHLGEMEGDDFLTLNLINSQDAGNVLWEWAFGSCYITTDVLAVSADSPSMKLAMFCIGGKEPDDTKSVTVKWTVSGPEGHVETTTQTSNTRSFFNQLHTSTVADSLYTVMAEVLKSSDPGVLEGARAETKSIRVDPGRPASVVIEVDEDTLAADTVTSTTVTAWPKDAFGNDVAEGTGVSWDVDYDGETDKRVSTVESDGSTTLEYTSGEELLATTVTASTGTVLGSIDIEKSPVGFQLTSSSSSLVAGSGDTVQLTITTQAADGTPVAWHTTRGQLLLVDDTIQGGKARATLQAARYVGDGQVRVAVASSVDYLVIKHVSPNVDLSGSVDLQAIVGGAGSTRGSVDIETVDISSRSVTTNTVSYSTSAALTVRCGDGAFCQNGVASKIILGSVLQPNALPEVYFPMNNIETAGGTHVVDEIQQLKAHITGTVTHDASQSLTLPGSSILLSGGYLEFADVNSQGDEAFAIAATLGFRAGQFGSKQVLLQRLDASGSLIWELELLPGGQLQARALVEHGAGSLSLVQTARVANPGQWHRAGIRISDGKLFVSLDGDLNVASEAVGLVGFGAGTIRIGGSFSGHIDDVRTFYESDANQILALNSLDSGELDFTGGSAQVSFTSTQNLPAFGAKVGFIYQARVDGNPDPVLYQSMEADIAIVPPETWGWTMEYIGKASFGESFEDVKQGAQLVYSLTGAADIGTLVDAVWLLSKGQSSEVSNLDVTFATVGLGATIAAVMTTGGAGLATVQGLLISFKALLKELLLDPLVDLAKTAVNVSKYLFEQLRNFVKSPSSALDAMVDFGAGINRLINAGTSVVRDFFARIRSLRNLDNWLYLGKRADDCLLGALPSASRYAFADRPATPMGLMERMVNVLISPAAAADSPVCPDYATWLAESRADVTARVGGDAAHANNVLNSVQASLRTMEELGIIVNENSVEMLTTVAIRGGPDTVEEFAKLLPDFTDHGWGTPSRVGVIDRYFEKLSLVPEDIVGYADWIRRLGSSTQQISGLYGEAYQIDNILVSVRLADGSLPPNTAINVNARTERQYINLDGKPVNPNSESVDVVVNIDNQRIIIGESKVKGSGTYTEAKKDLLVQFVKHVELEVADVIEDIIDTGLPVPELRYSLQGQVFDGIDVDTLA